MSFNLLPRPTRSTTIARRLRAAGRAHAADEHECSDPATRSCGGNVSTVYLSFERQDLGDLWRALRLTPLASAGDASRRPAEA